jgi:alpha-mannosidase
MLRISRIEPTVFFIEKKNELLQAVDIAIENTEKTVEATIDVRFDSRERHVDIGKVDRGLRTYRIYVPDVREPISAEFILSARGKVQDKWRMSWEPKKLWRVYMIPIAHHDFGYTDTIENVLCRYDGFYDDILRFCEDTEDFEKESKFRYQVEGSWSIQHFVENRPREVVEKLMRYVREGRIEIPALFGNEISALCGHEELIRLLYPSFRLKRKYGVKISTASITDIPGLSWGLPTVLKGAGVKYFFAGLATYFEWGRSDVHTFWDESAILREHGRPDAFWWQGPDGETVLVYYQGGYGCWSPSSLEEAEEELPRMLKEMEERGCPFSVVRYGFGCGDNLPPDIRVSHIVREWNSRWAYPKLIVATNSIFFEELEKECQDVRTFRGELPHTDYVVGAISTAKETGINRITHDRLNSAEKFTTVASLLDGNPYPAEEIREAYDNMVLYDEHTWGMAYQVGRVQDWNWSSKSHCAYKAAGLTESILDSSLNRIAGLIALEEEGRHIVVFNPLSFRRTDVVRVTGLLVEEPFDLIDEVTGRRVPHQIVELDSPQAPVPYSAHRYARGQFNRPELFDLVFVAEDVPSLGYKTYRIAPKVKTASSSSGIVVGETSLENRFFRVTLSPKTGAVESIYDKELKREIVDKEAPHMLNQFIARWVQTGEEEGPEEVKIQKGESGPVYGSLIVSGKGAGCPQLTSEIILYDEIKRIDFANRVLKDSTPLLEIYFAFPFLMENPDFRFEGSNSVIKPLVDQFPGSNSNYYTVQHWADVTDGEIGVTFSPIEAHLVEFGGLWPCYVSQAHHGVTPPDFGSDFVKPEELTKGHMYSFCLASNFRTNFQPVQQGDMLFRYSITTHKGDWREGGARDFGWAISNPLIPFCVNGRREGRLGREMSFLKVDRPNLLLLALKRAEDGDGIIVRLIETEGRESVATVTLPFITIRRALRTNLVEENEDILPSQKHTVTVPVKAFGIVTIRIQPL